MLDENLPTYVLKPSGDKPKQLSTYLYSQYGNDFEPAYSLKHPDPAQHDAKNRYAAALYDAYNPEILYAEVLLIPEWSQPTLSAEQVRLNGGMVPPPEPILPSEFTIQLYNPDQQVVVRQKPGSWNSAAGWDFEIPQQTFREPSASALDRTQDDPTASEITPKIGFRWKKDSKFSKDIVCFLRGKSTDPESAKKKSKEPDITVAIFKGLKEVTLYEPNLDRVEIEDLKGLEVVLLLGAAVIRDVYFAPMKETFNIPEVRSNPSSPLGSPLAAGAHPTSPNPNSNPPLPAREPRVPPTDPRTQWEIDAETARLKRLAMQEERDRRHREQAEEKRVRKMLEEEEKERRRKQAETDAETARLQKIYGREDMSARPALPARPAGHRHSSAGRPSSSLGHHQTQAPYYQNQAPYYPNQAPYYPVQPQVNLAPPQAWGGYGPNPAIYGAQAASDSGFLQPQQQRVKPKSSFFGLRRSSDDHDSRLQKKRSAVF